MLPITNNNENKLKLHLRIADSPIQNGIKWEKKEMESKEKTRRINSEEETNEAIVHIKLEKRRF